MKLSIAAIIFSVILVTWAFNNEVYVPCASPNDPVNGECVK